MVVSAKFLLKAMTVVVGLFGSGVLIAALVFSFTFIKGLDLGGGNAGGIIIWLCLIIPQLAVAYYIIKFAYLGWFRLSPATVEPICGMFALFAFALTMGLFTEIENRLPKIIDFVLALVIVFCIYRAYQSAQRYFLKEIFLINLDEQS